MLQEFTKGFFKRNPIFVLMVGMCPTLAITNSMSNALAMGVAVIVVLSCSNSIISLVRKVIPKGVRIPCYIVIIASFVSITEMLMKYFLPLEVNEKLSIFIPLIVVNCTILYRAEDFAQKNGVAASLLDGIGMGGGFTLAVLTVATFREVLGSGSVFGYKFSTAYDPIAAMVLPPGAFLVLGLLLAFFRWRTMRKVRIATELAAERSIRQANGGLQAEVTA